MSMTQQAQALKSASLHRQLDDLVAFLDNSLRQHDPLHAMEAGIWTRVLRLGHQLVAHVFEQCGSGDQGESLTLPDGRLAQNNAELVAFAAQRARQCKGRLPA